MVEKTLALPFSIDPYGKVSVTTDQSKIWADRVRSVMGTFLRERVMRPEFGSNIPYSVFNTQEAASEEISIETSQAFSQHLPLLTLDSVSSSFDSYSGIINVTITYKLPNDIVVDTTIGILTVRGNTPPYEENL
jgi:phage baseplate assembly protein W